MKWMLMLLFAATLAVGCNKSSSDEEDTADAVDNSEFSESRVTKLADKYAEGKFTEKDYKEAIDIIDAYNNALLEKAESLAKSAKTQEEFGRKISRFENKYAYIRELNFLYSDDEYKMGSENYEYLQKVQQKFQERAQRITDRIIELPSRSSVYGACDTTESVAVCAEAPAEVYEEEAPVAEAAEAPAAEAPAAEAPAADVYPAK
mgnify:CR=1 FL=1